MKSNASVAATPPFMAYLICLNIRLAGKNADKSCIMSGKKETGIKYPDKNADIKLNMNTTNIPMEGEEHNL